MDEFSKIKSVTNLLNKECTITHPQKNISKINNYAQPFSEKMYPYYVFSRYEETNILFRYYFLHHVFCFKTFSKLLIKIIIKQIIYLLEAYFTCSLKHPLLMQQSVPQLNLQLSLSSLESDPIRSVLTNSYFLPILTLLGYSRTTGLY